MKGFEPPNPARLFLKCLGLYSSGTFIKRRLWLLYYSPENNSLKRLWLLYYSPENDSLKVFVVAPSTVSTALAKQLIRKDLNIVTNRGPKKGISKCISIGPGVQQFSGRPLSRIV